MVGLYCAVSGCRNNLAKCRKLGLNITFHRFPTDPCLREIWIESCNRGEDWRKANVFMCSEHFTPTDFHTSTTDGGQKRTYLVKGAVPCRNLPASEYECCAVGCTDSPPEILVRRFPTDITRITELLGDVPRKQGISLSDCYLCERHVVLKKFLKDEVEKIAKKQEAKERDIVILEVSQVDGKHSTKLIEPPAKRRKVTFKLEEPLSQNDVVKRSESKVMQPKNRDGSLVPEHFFTDEKKVLQPSSVIPEDGPGMSLSSTPSSNIGADPLPVLVKNGGTSELMFLHRLPHISAGSMPKLDTFLNTGMSKSCGNTAPSEKPLTSSEPKKNRKIRSTGDMLVDRLYKRIQELEERIVIQRERYNTKMAELKDKCDSKVRNIISRLNDSKSESPSYNRVHRNFVNKGLIYSTPKPSPSISDEVHQILNRSFTSNQIKKIIDESETVRWTDSELLDAYTLKHLSYGAYTFVRNRLKFPLPSPKHLRRWLLKVEKERAANANDYGYSESENYNELDVLLAESVDSENLRGEFILERPSDAAYGDDVQEENVDDEGMSEDLRDSKEILIVADPDDASSINEDFSNQGFVLENDTNDIEAYSAMGTSKESLLSPELYVLIPANETTHDVEPSKDVSSSSGNLSECELTVRTDNGVDESDRFGHVVIVEKAEERRSPSKL